MSNENEEFTENGCKGRGFGVSKAGATREYHGSRSQEIDHELMSYSGVVDDALKKQYIGSRLSLMQSARNSGSLLSHTKCGASRQTFEDILDITTTWYLCIKDRLTEMKVSYKCA